MYTKYQMTATSTVAQVLADIVLLMTGTTDVNALSASCDKTTSQIVANVAAGLTVHDAAAGANSVCFKAPNLDGITFKYVTITVQSVNIQLMTFESWNATTHVGTNLCGNTATMAVTLNANAILFIFANARFVALKLRNGTSPTWTNLHGCFEFTRDDPWNTAVNGYPCWVHIQSEFIWSYVPSTVASIGIMTPRMKQPSGDKLANLAAASMQASCPACVSCSEGGSGNGPESVGQQGGYPRGADFASIDMPIWDIQVQKSYNDGGFNFLRGGKLLGGVQATTQHVGALADELIYNGGAYFYNKNTSGPATLLPKF